MRSWYDKLRLSGQKEIVVLDAPENFQVRFASLEGVVEHRDTSGLHRVDYAVAFVTTHAELLAAANAILPKASEDPMLFFAYPNLRSKRYRCEFNRKRDWDLIRKAGFEDNRQVAPDEDWSLLRFRRIEHTKRVYNASKLTELRIQRGWSQGELGRRAGVTQSFISKLTNSRIESPEMFSLQKIADALQVSITTLLNASAEYHSVFISYGGPDEMFARALYDALMKAGVETFFFPESAPPGQRLHRTMSSGVNQYGRILLICSKASLGRPGVLNELEQVLAREAREGGAELLIPVTIDEYVFDGWRPEREDIATQVRDRVIADFRSAAPATPDFARRIDRILRQLERSPSK
jgi:transcriptional regulator with XRE-family HTH domain